MDTPPGRSRQSRQGVCDKRAVGRATTSATQSRCRREDRLCHFRLLSRRHQASPCWRTCHGDVGRAHWHRGGQGPLLSFRGRQRGYNQGGFWAPDSLVFGTIHGDYEKGDARLWDASTGTLLMRFHGHSSFVEIGCISADYSLLATGACDWLAVLHRIDQTELLGTLPGNAAGNVVYSPDGAHIASCDSDTGQPVMWHASTGRADEGTPLRLPMLAATADGATKSVEYACSVAFDPSGQRLAAGTKKGAIALWSLAGARELLWHTPPDEERAHADEVRGLCFHPRRNVLASSDSKWHGRCACGISPRERFYTASARQRPPRPHARGRGLGV